MYKEIVFPRGGGCAVPPTLALTHNGTQVIPYMRNTLRRGCTFLSQSRDHLA